MGEPAGGARKYHVGDRVFVQLNNGDPSYLPWPAQVQDWEMDRDTYFVKCYGTLTTAWVKPEMIHPYTPQMCLKFSKPTNKPFPIPMFKFQAALKEIEANIDLRESNVAEQGESFRIPVQDGTLPIHEVLLPPVNDCQKKAKQQQKLKRSSQDVKRPRQDSGNVCNYDVSFSQETLKPTVVASQPEIVLRCGSTRRKTQKRIVPHISHGSRKAPATVKAGRRKVMAETNRKSKGKASGGVPKVSAQSPIVTADSSKSSNITNPVARAPSAGIIRIKVEKSDSSPSSARNNSTNETPASTHTCALQTEMNQDANTLQSSVDGGGHSESEKSVETNGVVTMNHSSQENVDTRSDTFSPAKTGAAKRDAAETDEASVLEVPVGSSEESVNITVAVKGDTKMEIKYSYSKPEEFRIRFYRK